jgi:hypothetical protein
VSNLSLTIALVVAFSLGYLLRSWVAYERKLERGLLDRHHHQQLSQLDRRDGLRSADTHPGPVCLQYVQVTATGPRCGLCGAGVNLTTWE